MNTIVSGSLNHSCLRSFLEHARATGLNPQSTVYLGTRYEYLVARTLERLGFSLVRVGRGGDGGVDLLGEWTLPFGRRKLSSSSAKEQQQTQQSLQAIHQSPLRVLLQCKRFSRRLTPEFVRELEGAFAGVPVGWRRTDNSAIGFLVTTREASRGVLEAVQRSRMPLGFIALEERISGGSDAGRKTDVADGMDGRVKQLLWNWRAQEMGLQGIGVTWRHTDGTVAADEPASSELTLTWNGRAVLGAMSPAGDQSQAAITDQPPFGALSEPPKKRGRPKKNKS